MSDAEFTKAAAQGGLAEVKSGGRAEQKAANRAVKNFSRRIGKNHTQANEKLKPDAEKNISLPTAMNAKDQANYDRHSKLSDPAFNRAYTRARCACAHFRSESSC